MLRVYIVKFPRCCQPASSFHWINSSVEYIDQFLNQQTNLWLNWLVVPMDLWSQGRLFASFIQCMRVFSHRWPGDDRDVHSHSICCAIHGYCSLAGDLLAQHIELLPACRAIHLCLLSIFKKLWDKFYLGPAQQGSKYINFFWKISFLQQSISEDL